MWQLPTSDQSAGNGSQELRRQRVWRLVNVQFGTWLFFAIFSAVRNLHVAAVLCFFEAVVMFAIFRLRGKTRLTYAAVMNISLVFSGTGIFFVSLTDPSLARTMLFFPVSTLIASQLLGVRASFYWALIGVVAQIAFYLVLFGPLNVWQHYITELTLTVGTTVCLFFCCHQGEVFYQERTRELTDLSQRLKEKGERLHRLATRDALTGLINRRQFHTLLAENVKHATDTGENMALIVIDMDGFKTINDTLGHPAGDQTLVEVSNRLQTEFQDEAVVARLGGDEFCVIVPNVFDTSLAKNFAARTCNAIRGRFEIDRCEVHLDASVGIALCPEDAQDQDELLAFADTAMFAAKASRKGYARYESEMTENLIEDRNLKERLTAAIDSEQFSLVYQPQIAMTSGKIIGVEALLRWAPNGIQISPTEFIKVLESSGEIVEVGQWVIREACQQLRKWNDAGHDINVSINLSSVQFKDEQLIGVIEDRLQEFGIQANRLDFEITESLMIENLEQALDRLNRIKKLGASISIDDFGTGYSSLAYLKQLPLDRLKIDSAFVQDIPHGDDGSIARSIVALGQAIGVRVLAEGVETQQQLDVLASMDCDEYQGYFFSEPIEGAALESLLNSPDQSSSRANVPENASLARWNLDALTGCKDA